MALSAVLVVIRPIPRNNINILALLGIEGHRIAAG